MLAIPAMGSAQNRGTRLLTHPKHQTAVLDKAPFAPRKKVVSRQTGTMTTSPVAPGRSLRSIMRQAGSGSEIWGNVISNSEWDGEKLQGIYAFTPDDPNSQELLIRDRELITLGGSALVDGQLYLVTYDGYGDTYYFYLYQIDTTTWDFVEVDGDIVDYLDDATLYAMETAQDPATGTVYGECVSDDGNDYMLSVIDYPSRSRRDIGYLYNEYLALGFSVADNCLYGVATNGNLYKINPLTADEQKIGETGVDNLADDEGAYTQSGEIDPATGIFYWACTDLDEQSTFYTVDLTTGEATKVAGLTGEITALTIPAAVATGAPTAVTDLSANFEGASLTGSVTFTMPTLNQGGEPLEGQLSYTVAAGAETMATGTAQPGQQVAETITVEEGQVDLKVTVANDEGKSPAASLSVWAGNDQPMMPANVSLTIDAAGKASVSWTASADGEHGGYVGQIVYNVVRLTSEGRTTVAEGTTATAFAETLERTAYRPYQYLVVAVNGTQQSDEAASNIIPFGKAYELPYAETFDTRNDRYLYTVVDANDDGITWTFNSRLQNLFNSYNDKAAADDWAISPNIRLAGGRTYTLTFDVMTARPQYEEQIEVRVGQGTTVAAMTQTVMEPTAFSTERNTPQQMTVSFAIDADGEYNLGFHAVSAADQASLYLDNIALDVDALPAAPQAVTALTATAAPQGELKATLQFTTPTMTVEGNATTLTKAIVMRDGELAGTIDAPAVGTTITFTDEHPVQGMNNYIVTVFNAAGESPKATASVYVGQDVPTLPQSPKAIDHLTHVTLSWEAPAETGANGGYVCADDIVYEVNSVSGTVIGSLLGRTEKGVTTFDVDMNTNEGKQGITNFAIRATNVAGNSNYTAATLITGAPYELPFAEHFAGKQFENMWWRQGTNVSAYFENGSTDADGTALHLYTYEAGTEGRYITGKISLGGAANPVLTFAHKGMADTKLIVEIKTADSRTEAVSTIEYGESADWTESSVSLAAFKDEPYVMVAFHVVGLVANSGVSIDDILIADDNSSVGIASPVSGTTGERRVYSVAGQRVGGVGALRSGVYIVDGRKTVVR